MVLEMTTVCRFSLRNPPYITSAKDWVLRWRSEKSKNNADVVCGWSLTTIKEFLKMTTGDRTLVKVVKNDPLMQDRNMKGLLTVLC